MAYTPFPIIPGAGSGGGGGSSVHNDLTGRSAADAHPTSAITGLDAALAAAGGGAVDSVNGETGAVVLDAADVGALPSASGYNTANGWLKLDGSGTAPDSTLPSSIARDSEVSSAISTHAAATDPHGDRAYAAGLVDDLSGVTNAATALATLGGLSTTGGGKDTVSDLGSMTGAVTVDLANGNSFHGVLSENVTSWTLLNATSGKECEAIIEITQHASSAKTVAYPSAWKWAGGTDHVMSTGVGAVDVIVLRTRDGGTTIHAAVMGKAFA